MSRPSQNSALRPFPSGCRAVLSAVLVVAGGFGTPSVWARELPKFAELDTNEDGRLSVEEASADPSIASRFAQADLDRSGYLSREEFEQRSQP